MFICSADAVSCAVVQRNVANGTRKVSRSSKWFFVCTVYLTISITSNRRHRAVIKRIQPVHGWSGFCKKWLDVFDQG